jgi:DNA-binding GntR family transcriptional regulator
MGGAFERVPLRTKVRRVVQRAILQGALAPGGDVNEAALAAQLGVSRTPLREALLGLESEGYLESAAGRGFSVAPLTERDVNEIYPVLWTLEGLALRASAPLKAATVKRLAEINKELEGSARSSQKALALDRKWHDLLLSGCRNRLLLQTIGLLKDLGERYELAYMRHSGQVPISAKQHRAILTALRKGNLDRAVQHLEENWRVSQDFLVPWIQALHAPKATR